MKIIFFDFSTLEYAGGCEKNFMNLGNWLRKRGHESSYITATEKLNNLYCTISRQGFHTQNLKTSDLNTAFGVKQYTQFRLIDLFFSTKRRKNLQKQISEADCIYSKNEIFETLILKYAFKIEPHKIVFGFHTPIHYPTTRNLKSKLHNWLYSSKLYWSLIRDSNVRSLVLSREDKELLLRYSPNQSIAVIPNPLNVSLFKQKKYLHGNKFKVYYIGRMVEQKGIDILAKAIGIISEINSNFAKMDFYFIGEGDKADYLKDLSKIYSNCSFLGFQTNVVNHYQNADLVVAPSRAESFCYSVAEAQSSGIPVITTDIPGPRDIVINKKTGWIVPSEDPSLLAHSIINAYELWESDLITYSKMGENGRLNIIENFEENRINERTENFLLQNTMYA